MLRNTIRSDLRSLFNEAVASVNPQKLIQDHVKVTSRCRGMDFLLVGGKEYRLASNVYIVGFGKAVLGMARALEQLIQPHLKAGIISVPVGTVAATLHLALPSKLEIIECAKDSLPDEESEMVAHKITDLVKELPLGINISRPAPTILIVLISGGGSALLTLPVSDISLAEKLHVTKSLGDAGASIRELNCVRKKLSQVKGGRLACMAYPAQVISLIISDVVGDRIDTIASGPTCPSLDSPSRAWEVILKYQLESKISENIVRVLRHTKYISETSDFSHVSNVVIGNNSIALTAVKTKAHSLKYNSVVLSNTIRGDARDIGVLYASLATNACCFWSPKLLGPEEFILEGDANRIDPNLISTEVKDTIDVCVQTNNPLCLVLGGETTVQVSGCGKGGRNQELALAFAIEMFRKCEQYSVLKKFEVVLLSAGTDGIDGPTVVAGAIGYGQLIHQAQRQLLDPSSYLRNNDSYNFFAKLCDGNEFIRTGHTGTNVMDVHILIIAPL